MLDVVDWARDRSPLAPVHACDRVLLRSGGSSRAGSSRLWEAALALEEWDVVADVGPDLDVLTEAGSLLAERPWAVVVEVLHLDRFERARLANDCTMRAMDRRTGDLLVVPPASAQLVDELLDAEWVHSQDVLLTARVPA